MPSRVAHHKQSSRESRRLQPVAAWLVDHGPLLVVLAAIVLAALVRIRLSDMPLERDEGEYAYAGQLILKGIPPTSKPTT